MSRTWRKALRRANSSARIIIIIINTDCVYQGEYYGETSGSKLGRSEVEKARREGVAYLKHMDV